MVYLFVREFRMLLDFFVWDVNKVRNIHRNRYAVAVQRLLVHLFSGFSECMWLILRTLCRFGRHISFAWFDLNLLRQVSVAVVQISDHEKCAGVLIACNILSLLLLQEDISCYCRKISVDLTSSVIVRCGSFCTAM